MANDKLDGGFIQQVLLVIHSAQSFIDADAAHGADHEITQDAKALLADALVALMPGLRPARLPRRHRRRSHRAVPRRHGDVRPAQPGAHRDRRVASGPQRPSCGGGVGMSNTMIAPIERRHQLKRREQFVARLLLAALDEGAA